MENVGSGEWLMLGTVVVAPLVLTVAASALAGWVLRRFGVRVTIHLPARGGDR